MTANLENMFQLTLHAKQRRAQRSIKGAALRILRSFGEKTAAQDGCHRLMLRRNVARELVAEPSDMSATCGSYSKVSRALPK